jgi:uncharacterized protein YjbI with pentapeptide repeats
MKNIDNLSRKPFFLFFIWLLGLYILTFILCLYVHVKESNIIANRADDLLGKLVLGNHSNWSKIANVQNMVRKTKPVFWELLKSDNSLFGKREFYGVINRRLAKEIENNKNYLGGLFLGQVHLEGANLAEADMRGTYLEKANMSGADLRGANLITAELVSVNLSRANLSDSKLFNANLSGAILKESKFGKAQLHKARFQGADLRGANLNSADGLTCGQIKSAAIDEKTLLPDYLLMEAFSDSEFKCRNLQEGKGLNLDKMNLSNSNLSHLDLRKYNFRQTNLENTKIGWSQLQNVNFSQANLKKASFPYSQLNNANLNEANLKGANLSTTQLHKARFQGADLRGTNLNSADGLTCGQIKSAVIDEETLLPGYLLMEASSDSEFNCINLRDGKGLNLSKINLSNANLPSVDLRESDLSQGDFQNANLRLSQLQNANLSNANLKQANLYYSQLNNANLSEANLKGANLTITQLHEAHIQGADLRGANLDHAAGLTCEQIKSAVIDEKTRLPNYISLTGSLESEYICVHSPAK